MRPFPLSVLAAARAPEHDRSPGGWDAGKPLPGLLSPGSVFFTKSGKGSGLARGRYRLTVVLTAPDGRRSAPVARSLSVTKRP